MATTETIAMTVEMDLTEVAAKFRKAAAALDPEPEPVGSWGWAVAQVEGGRIVEVVEASLDTQDDAEQSITRSWQHDHQDRRYVAVQLVEPSH